MKKRGTRWPNSFSERRLCPPGVRSLPGQSCGFLFLEIGCGSGHSIRYLMSKGAARVHGLDISSTQLGYAERLNKKWIDAGSVTLTRSAMEDPISVRPVDVVYSIYGFGWTVDPVKTLKNIRRYVKARGLFVWSFEHAVYAGAECRLGKVVVRRSYHDERARLIWKGRRNATGARRAYRKVSTWFRLLTDAGFAVERYLEPAPARSGRRDSLRIGSAAKAKLIPATMIFVCRKR